MPVEVRFKEDAVRDLGDAFLWYELQNPGLGEQFLSALVLCIDSIREFPERNALVDEHLRRALLHRFPYGVFYEFRGESAVVIAVLHMAASPDKWGRRISNA